MVEVVEARPLEVLKLRLRFSDGKGRVVDLSALELPGLLSRLRDPGFFAQVRVDPELGARSGPGLRPGSPGALREGPGHRASPAGGGFGGLGPLCAKANFRAGKGEKRPNWPLGLHRLAMDPGGEGGVYARRLTEIPEGGKGILLQSGPLP